ncbi:DUF5689 domain-containing protein [Cognatitamlana onchidii]|uniref:DUF5689 domain-containing protein n=1 Tax=Cognatitamlana onchidii TaxID=2562860 RepID=UPI0010A693E9|nr:DUF5689 domain-containing protein [Algibacter onchidii]
MKTSYSKVLKKILSIALLTFMACVKSDDYSIPDISYSEPQIPQSSLTTFKSIKSLFEQAVNDGNSTVVIPNMPDLYIEGYVVSTDKFGNFFEELIVQNKTNDSSPDDDPRLGFKIDINSSNLSDIYQFGQKVYVKMNGLTVGDVDFP